MVICLCRQDRLTVIFISCFFLGQLADEIPSLTEIPLPRLYLRTLSESDAKPSSSPDLRRRIISPLSSGNTFLYSFFDVMFTVKGEKLAKIDEKYSMMLTHL